MIRAKNAFTLVELLVVIAIISVLAALLLPALDRAVFSARELQCSANMRSQYAAQILYSYDFRGRFAPHMEVGPDYARWGNAVTQGFTPLRTAIASYLPDSAIMLCPLHKGSNIGTQKAFVDLRYSAGNYGGWDSSAENIFSAYMWYANYYPGSISTTDGSKCCPARVSQATSSMIFINHRMALYNWWTRIQDFGHSGDMASAATGLAAGPWVSRSSANTFADGHTRIIPVELLAHRLNWNFSPGGTRLFY